jgi:hypothetical protein
MVFSATNMKFLQRTIDSAFIVDNMEPPAYEKYRHMLSPFVSFVRGACNSLWVTVEQLELAELYLQVISAVAEAKCSLVHPCTANSAQRYCVALGGVDTFELRQCCAVLVCRVICIAVSSRF